jgi:hypothetical protein
VKTLLLIPIVLLLVAGACWGSSVAMGWRPHGRELIAAATACGIAGVLALAPAVLMRGGDAAGVSQTALLGTVIHMFIALLLAAIIWLGRLVADRSAFLFMLLAFYWISLIVLVLALARLVRQASQSKSANAGPTPTTR